MQRVLIKRTEEENITLGERDGKSDASFSPLTQHLFLCLCILPLLLMSTHSITSSLLFLSITTHPCSSALLSAVSLSVLLLLLSFSFCALSYIKLCYLFFHHSHLNCLILHTIENFNIVEQNKCFFS